MQDSIEKHGGVVALEIAKACKKLASFGNSCSQVGFHYHHRVTRDAPFLGRKKNFDLVMRGQARLGDDLPGKSCHRANFRSQEFSREGAKMLAEAIGSIEQGTPSGLGWKDDSSLVDVAKQGDPVAFEILVARYEKTIFFRALRVTRNHEDAEDVVQQSFQKAFVHLSDFEGRSSFVTWLTRIALNEALMLRRRSRRWREVSVEEPSAGEEVSREVEIPDSGPDPEHHYFQQERQRLLLAAIDGLRPGMRSALHICDLGERSIEETAQILGLSAAAVKSRVNRARRVLRHKLNRPIGMRARSGRLSVGESKLFQRPN